MNWPQWTYIVLVALVFLGEVDDCNRKPNGASLLAIMLCYRGFLLFLLYAGGFFTGGQP